MRPVPLAPVLLAPVLLLVPGPARADTDALVERLFERLGAERAADRELAKNRLLLFGDLAVVRALARVDDAPSRARAELIDLLSRSGRRKGMMRAIQGLDDADEFVARRAAASLLEAEPEGVDILLKVAIDQGAIRSALGRSLGRQVLETHVFELIERNVRSKIAESGGHGFFEGQFADLREVDEAAGRVILTMFLEGSEYEYLYPVADDEERYKLDFLVGEALGDVATEDMLPILRQRHQDEKDEKRKEAILNAMARLGDAGPLRVQIEEMERRVARRFNTQALHDLANLYYRARMHDKALEVYNRILALDASDTIALYNKACSLSRLRRIDEAFEALYDAFRRGYDDLDWAHKDGDLANLREDRRWAEFVRWARGR